MIILDDPKQYRSFHVSFQEFIKHCKNIDKTSHTQDITLHLEDDKGIDKTWTFSQPSNPEEIKLYYEPHFITYLSEKCSCHHSSARLLENILCGEWVGLGRNINVCLPRTCKYHGISAVSLLDSKQKYIYNIQHCEPHSTMNIQIDSKPYQYFQLINALEIKPVPLLKNLCLRELVIFQIKNVLPIDNTNPLLKQTNKLIPFLQKLDPEYHLNYKHCYCKPIRPAFY